MRCDGVLRVTRCMLTTPGEHVVGAEVNLPDSIRVRDRAGLDTTARVIGIVGIAIGAAGLAGVIAERPSLQMRRVQQAPPPGIAA